MKPIFENWREFKLNEVRRGVRFVPTYDMIVNPGQYLKYLGPLIDDYVESLIHPAHDYTDAEDRLRRSFQALHKEKIEQRLQYAASIGRGGALDPSPRDLDEPPVGLSDDGDPPKFDKRPRNLKAPRQRRYPGGAPGPGVSLDAEMSLFNLPDYEDYLEVLKQAGGDSPDTWIHIKPEGSTKGQALYDDIIELSGDSKLFNPDEDWIYYNHRTNKIAIAKGDIRIRGIFELPEHVRWDFKTGRWSARTNLSSLTNWVPEYIPKDINPHWTGELAHIEIPEIRVPSLSDQMRNPKGGRFDRNARRRGSGGRAGGRWPMDGLSEEEYVPKDYETAPLGETRKEFNERIARMEKMSPEHARFALDEVRVAEKRAKQSLKNRELIASLTDNEKKIFNKQKESFLKQVDFDTDLAEKKALDLIRARRKLVEQGRWFPSVRTTQRASKLPAKAPAGKGWKTWLKRGAISLSGLLIFLGIITGWFFYDAFTGGGGIPTTILDSILTWIFGEDYKGLFRRRNVKIPENREELLAFFEEHMHEDQIKDYQWIATEAVINSISIGTVDWMDEVASEEVERASRTAGLKWSLWNSQIGLPNKKLELVNVEDMRAAEAWQAHAESGAPWTSPWELLNRGERIDTHLRGEHAQMTDDKEREHKLQCAVYLEEYNKLWDRWEPMMHDHGEASQNFARRLGYELKDGRRWGRKGKVWRPTAEGPLIPGKTSCEKLRKQGIWAHPRNTPETYSGRKLKENQNQKVIKLKILKEQKKKTNIESESKKQIKLKILKESKE